MGGLFSPSATQQSTTQIPEELKPYQRESAEFLRGRLGQQGPAWPGPFTAPQTPQEQYGLGGIEQSYANAANAGLQPLSVSGYQQYLGAGAAPIAGQQQAATLGGAYLPGANPYLGQIEQGLQKDYQDTLADAQNKLALAGHGANSTAGALMGSRAASEFNRNLGQMRLGAYEAERSRMTNPFLMAQPVSALEMGMTYPVSMAQSLMQAGAVPRTLAQGELNQAYQEMQRLWNESYRSAGQANPLFSPVRNETTYGPSPFMSLLSGAMPFAMMRGMNRA